MHPEKRNGNEREHEHEAARPDAREIVHDSESNRQNKSAKPSDHTDRTAHHTDIPLVIDRYVFEHGGHTQRHKEPEYEDEHAERHEPGAGRKCDRAVNAMDDVVGLRVGEHESAHHRHAEGEIHDSTGAVLVG